MSQELTKDEGNVYDLFTHTFVVEGQHDQYSNTIDLWDLVPKYFISSRKQTDMRKNSDQLPVQVHEVVVEGKRYKLVLQPATVLEDTGKRDEKDEPILTPVQYYPSENEELIEDVIRKVFMDQNYGEHIAEQEESRVAFSLQMIARELKKYNKSRSITEIKKAITILRNTSISLYRIGKNKPLFSNNILSDLVTVDRDAYLSDSTSLWAVRLPWIASKGINTLHYRQFNYVKLMEQKTQLDRYIFKRLSHNFVNANRTQSYHFALSTIVNDSKLVSHSRTDARIKFVQQSLNRLIKRGIIVCWEQEVRKAKTGNRIEDVIFDLYATEIFIKEQKAASAAHNYRKKMLGFDSN
ncbi:MAG: hypothetical protein OEZ58_00095 [Gammaproteobacteria bacterium]|nr:hypothetical protein [Gammaproteobacteria bacterium]